MKPFAFRKSELLPHFPAASDTLADGWTAVDLGLARCAYVDDAGAASYGLSTGDPMGEAISWHIAAPIALKLLKIPREESGRLETWWATLTSVNPIKEARASGGTSCLSTKARHSWRTLSASNKRLALSALFVSDAKSVFLKRFCPSGPPYLSDADIMALVKAKTEQSSSALREFTAHFCNCLHDGTADDSLCLALVGEIPQFVQHPRG